MGGTRVFRLHLLALVLVIFLTLIRTNSSEEFGHNVRTLTQNPRDSGSRSAPHMVSNEFENEAQPTRYRRGILSKWVKQLNVNKRKGTLAPDHKYHVPPKVEQITGFPNLKNAKRKGANKRWKDEKTQEIFEWDTEKGELERYNRRGKHLGSYDPYTGAQRSPAKPERSIEP